jgi:hypothetical protein
MQRDVVDTFPAIALPEKSRVFMACHAAACHISFTAGFDSFSRKTAATLFAAGQFKLEAHPPMSKFFLRNCCGELITFDEILRHGMFRAAIRRK